MDRELAGAVLQRWDEGLPVAETALYKAASVLGIDPQLALAEARYYTRLDSFLLEKRAMTRDERSFFSRAAGIDPRLMVKTAAAHGLSADELIVEALREHKAVYLGATGGAAALIARRIVSSEIVAYEDLGPEAIRRLEVVDFPATVIIDCRGNDAYVEGRRKYQKL